MKNQKIYIVFSVFFCFLFFAASALAQSPARIKIISPSQSIATSTPSAVITVEVQDESGAKINAAPTTRVSLSSSSASGQFMSSPALGPCGDVLSSNTITIAQNTSHKSFCYIDSASGKHTLTASVSEQPDILADTQTIEILDVQTATTTPEVPLKNDKIKIFAFLPNPAGADEGAEWVEIKNSGENPEDLAGWLLDDKDTGTGPGASAFVLSGIVNAGEIKRFILPTGAFSLNNSGGDEVNLYFPDKTLADKAVYAVTAYDDGVIEFRDGQWQPPARENASVSFGGSSGSSGSGSSTQQYAGLKLNEIFPNALGDDAGTEWIELYNPTNATVSPAGYFLADGDSDSFSSSAWPIVSETNIGPMGVLAIILPKDAVALNNSGSERVKLFSPQKQLIDSIIYQDAEENRSYAKISENKWEWGIPTFGKENNFQPPVLNLIFSKIFPKPKGDEEEFVELSNLATTTANLDGAALLVGSRKKVFEPGTQISSGGFLTIPEDELPARLSNLGQTIKLYDSFGRLVAEAQYPKAENGLAYASLDGKVYNWETTKNLTALTGAVLGLALDMGGAPDSENISAKKAAKPVVSKVSVNAKQTLNEKQEMENRLAQMELAINDLKAQLSLKQNVALAAQEESGINASPRQAEDKAPGIWIVFAGIGVLIAVIYFVFRYLKI